MRGLELWLKAWRALNPARRKWMPLRVWWWLKPPIRVYAHTASSLDQSGFQFFNDGTESGAASVAAEDTNATLDVDTVYHIRIQVDDTASGIENNVTLQLQRNLNSAGWVSVDGISTVVQSSASQLVEGNDTTARLTAPTGGTFITPNSGQDEVDGLAGQNNDIDYIEGTHDYVEVVYAFQILSADVADSDTIQFRVVRSGGAVLEGYSVIPQATVNEAAGGAQELTGTLFAKAPTFPTGAVDASNTLTGTLFSLAPTFLTGAVDATYDLAGTLFASTPSFPQGSVSAEGGAQTLTGTLFTSTPTFPQGTVDSTVDLAGTLFTSAPSFPQGAVDATYDLTGATFTSDPSFPQGSVDTTYDLTGTVFTLAPSFPTGSVSLDGSPQTLTGNIFTSTPSFPQGSVSLDGGPQTLTGNLFTSASTFPTGTVAPGAVSVTGTLFASAPTFPQGGVSAVSPLTGTVFTSAPSFPTGTVTTGAVQLTGTLFALAPTFPTGFVGSGEKRKRTEGSGVLLSGTEASKVGSGFLEGSRV